MPDKPPVVVVISADPRASHRANEAMRIGLGVAANDNDVVFVLAGPAAHLLDGDTDDLVDGDDIAKYRGTLAKLGIPFHIDRSAMPAEKEGWNEEGHPTVPVSREEIAGLIAGSRRFLMF